MSDELKACPNLGCNNAGWYPEAHEDIHNVGDWDSEVAWEQVQCEFCYTEPNSVFNVVNALRADKERAEKLVERLVEAINVYEDSYYPTGETMEQFYYGLKFLVAELKGEK